jgi:3-methylcrotonyl-CoA carboxylase alpha subunit
MIKKILIANRGEIACRIIRSAKKSGILTVAIYSDADRHGLHVQQADESYYIGPSPALQSYLNQENILQTALDARVDAIHPGYGFLAENPDFAQSCADQGLNFIGPPPQAIRLMGSKSAARELMEQAGVPILKGFHGLDRDPDSIANSVADIGYPVLLKPSAGGGGKGMKIVRASQDLTETLASARREALSAFGSDELIVEKYLEQTRHIEIQVFADQQGNCIHLSERDCSIQRRHQKVVEEAPAPGLSESLRQQLGSAAVNAARAVNYVGAGTVEFLLGNDHQFYFMEMNTRLQVEHPVTEMVTGLDLVDWQLRIANGDPLPCTQDDIEHSGHAIEVRIYAEDTRHDFLPASGQISHLRLPPETQNVRVDNGVVEAEQIGVFYDPMLMKVIAWNKDRSSAITSLQEALGALQIAGVKTNRDYLAEILHNDEYIAGSLHTLFLEQHHDALDNDLNEQDQLQVMATAAKTLLADTTHLTAGMATSPWQTDSNWRLNSPAGTSLYLRTAQDLVKLNLTSTDSGKHQITITTTEGEALQALIEDVALAMDCTHLTPEQITVFHPRRTVSMQRPHSVMEGHSEDERQVLAPMSGRIISINVSLGDHVEKGTILVVLEAMKMEHTLLAPESGEVIKLPYSQGDLVDEGTELAEIEPDEAGVLDQG